MEERFQEPSRGDLHLPADLVEWLRGHENERAGSRPRDMIHEKGSLKSRITFVRETAQGEILFRLSDGSGQAESSALRERFHLTNREAEVASSIAKGKSNRDIAAILSLSPRTIDKHLEVIFAKLNVENRTSAAALILGFRGTN